MGPIELLKRYAELTAQIEDAKHQLEFIESLLQEQVVNTGNPLSAYGLVARFKPGRTINHEAAVAYVIDSYSRNEQYSEMELLQEKVGYYSTTKVTVKWAEVTKAAKIDTVPFTVESEPVFVVEAVQA